MTNNRWWDEGFQRFLAEHLSSVQPSDLTVYRALKDVVDAGLLHRFELDGQSMYELNYGYPEHDHLYCTKCRQLIEFTSDQLVRIRDEAAEPTAFALKTIASSSKAPATSAPENDPWAPVKTASKKAIASGISLPETDPIAVFYLGFRPSITKPSLLVSSGHFV